MSHHNIDDSNSSSSSSEQSEGDEEFDEEDEDEDEYEQECPTTGMKHPPQLNSYGDALKPGKDALHWGVLRPFDSSYPGIDLYGSKMYIGPHSFNYVLENVSVEICISYIHPGEASLEITSSNGFVYINQRTVRKGDKVVLKEEDEIGFYYSKTYIFTLFFDEKPQMCLIDEMKTNQGIMVFNKEQPIQKMVFPEIKTPIKQISQTEVLKAIFKKFGRNRISQDIEGKVLRKEMNKATLKFLRPCEIEALKYTCEIPFVHPELIKFTKSITSLYRTLLLTIPKGGMKHLSRVVHALADEYDVPMLEINYDTLGMTIDAKSQERKQFYAGQLVQFIGKGKRQRDFVDDIELGTKGVVLYVKDSHAAVNFDYFNKTVACFVDIEYLGNINEEIPDTDQRVIGKLDEIIDMYGRKNSSEDKKGKMIILINNISSMNDNIQLMSDFKSYLRAFQYSDKNAIIIGTMVTPPPPSKSQSGPQMDQSLCMLGVKEFRFETIPFSKATKDQQKDLNNISKLFGNVLKFSPPTGELERPWKALVNEDAKMEKIAKNREMIIAQTTALRIKLLQYPGEEMTETYTPEQIEKAIGIAIEEARRTTGIANELSKEQIAHGLNTVREKKNIDIEEMETDNEFEKKLLSDVIRADDINVSFDDIGALDDVKEVLNETITLPLKRSELFFSKLTQGAKGVLLFGPPGTGKTMLAKAVATESKSNFINVSMSSLGSKWFGEAEKYVKALFTLASKLSPCVIFVDEVDALLGKRSSSEHEAVRKMKNEFMSLWDGLKSKEMERVIVMAATNRPFDLDDAVLRRLSRRILVDLPNETNRVLILKKILRREDVEKDLNYSIIAQQTEGFSGSDLFALGQMVAMRPIKEYLAKEVKGQKKDMNPVLRPLNTQDFLEEVKKINPSVSKDSSSLNELRRWNSLYGEGASTASTSLKYFL
ncbi:ATPase, AAA family protein [Entamoeba nuttalli P19]|uniref:ATPase, AAA family protein n=1 Tax=Entamoeba nuttalli (strain P19) TaxID=1076696 RepID=K2H801_ENTNP|nr:ATPase, AAA family protein [Entamoeba nuttalli P19]EKE42717.1 ATPase, AAA family protein [Entamoeba nuttalli P19]|eukprot:XP_008854948.1 ATPase, AAA family protein [Entamoeba nuttalli P19]